MVARPRFDFVSSLELCRELVKLAEAFGASGATRRRSRDGAIASDSFQGPYGVNHRDRAFAEDLLHDAVVEGLEAYADEWAAAWQSAADQMNAYAEYLAYEELDAIHANRVAIWQRSGYTYPDGTTVYPPYPQKGTVTSPAAAPKPIGSAYDPESAFAKYYQSGVNMTCSCVDSPPV